MRQRWLIVFLAAISSLALIAAACGSDSTPAVPSSDDSGSETSDQPSGDGEPTSSGFVAPNTFLTLEGQRYQLGDVFQADLISDDFTEIGAALEADIDFDGELTVYRRQGDDSAVYTHSPAVDGESEEEDVTALWLRWELVVDAPGEEPSGGDPTSSGFVAPNVFMTFEGQRYQLREVLRADLIFDDLTKLGAASEADIDFDGELTVFRRRGDDAAVYTYSPSVDAEDEEGDLPGLWNRWEPVD
ncbi:MAG: hypothetical protein IH864_06425 [Chloroflexi bacterium]|nr:hypothetical protein [Chloroflexota bacterium]